MCKTSFEIQLIVSYCFIFQVTSIIVKKNHFFKNDADGLKYVSTKIVDAGQMLSIGSDGLHSVVAEGNEDCYSFHVYKGPLSKIKRSLFDWNTGQAFEFTDENYHQLKKPANELSLGF